VLGCELAQCYDLKAMAAWRDQRPKVGAAHGHAVVAHLGEPAGAAAWLPPVDRWTRVAATAA
jgi:hypothetical protein